MNKKEQILKTNFLKNQAKFMLDHKERIHFLFKNFNPNVVPRMIMVSFPETYQAVLDATWFLELKKCNWTFSTRLYYFLNDLHDYVKCQNCNEPIFKNVRSALSGYIRDGKIGNHCSMSCAQQDPKVIQEHKDNYKAKRGVNSPFEDKELRDT